MVGEDNWLRSDEGIWSVDIKSNWPVGPGQYEMARGYLESKAGVSRKCSEYWP